ncbi:hypothetical protein [Rhizobium sp. NXC14]|uniref:hypothetical protein n=1 Tax=Rhizobium sp. NXC14 TaxID=1981173 RepID=UPI0018DDACC7|nr:hypothetical protein [Rhizobium sp. NXC14]
MVTYRWRIGFLSGIAIAAVPLFQSGGASVESYLAALSTPWIAYSALGCALVRVFAFGLLGGAVVRNSTEPDGWKICAVAVAAPATLSVMLGFSPDSRNEVPVNGRSSLALQVFDAGLAGLQALPLKIEQLDVPGVLESNPSPGSVNNGENVDPAVISTLVGRFSGPDRKLASDSLVSLYEESSSSQGPVVQALIGNLQNDGRYRYRINLYIARTLGLLKEGWSSSKKDFDTFHNAVNLDIDDKTMAYWAGLAERKWVEKK